MQTENNPFKDRFTSNFPYLSRVVQWKSAGPITQRSMDRNHPLLNARLPYDMQNDNNNLKVHD